MSRYQALRSAGEIIVQGSDQLYVDLDVEADGVAGYGSLLSIGAVSPWGETFYRELRPSSEAYIGYQRRFCEEHKLERTRLLDEGEDPHRVVAELSEWVGDLGAQYRKKGNAVMAAFNASFDFPLVGEAYARAGLKNPFGPAGFCIKSLAMAVVPEYDWTQTAKSRLPNDIVPPGDFTHNALEDAVYQQNLHFALAGRLAELSQETLRAS